MKKVIAKNLALAIPAIGLLLLIIFLSLLPSAPKEKIIRPPVALLAQMQLFFPLHVWLAAAIGLALFMTGIVFYLKSPAGRALHHPKIVRTERAIKKPRLLLLVLDGAADRPAKALGGKTPYEAARLPNINSIAALGQITQLHVIPKVAPESDEAVMALLGYEPKKYYTGRGATEAVGIGADFKDGDLAVRGNFATVKKVKGEYKLIDPRITDLTTAENRQLVDWLNKKLPSVGDSIFEKAELGYREIVIVKSKKKLSAAVSNTHPGYVKKDLVSVAVPYEQPIIKKCVPLNKTAEARFTAEIINRFTSQTAALLEKHPLNKKRIAAGKRPANFILLRDASIKKPRLFNINMKYDKRWAILADMPTEVGIGKAAGMSVVRLPEPSEDAKKDYNIRAKKTLDALKKHDCVYVHLKGPDIRAHEGNVLKKKESLEQIDRFFFGPLLKKLDLSSTIVCITSDHSTPCSLRVHSADPVPLAVYAPPDSGIKAEGLKLNEQTAKRKSRAGYVFGEHYLRGTHLVPDLMRLMRHVALKHD